MDQARRDGSCGAHLLIGVSKRIHLFQWISALDSRDVTRRQCAWRHGEHQHQRCQEAARNDATYRVGRQELRGGAHHVAATAESLVELIEGQRRPWHGSSRAEPLEHAHGDDVCAPLTVSEHITPQQVGIAHHHDPSTSEGKPCGRFPRVRHPELLALQGREGHAAGRRATHPPQPEEVDATVRPQRRRHLAMRVALGAITVDRRQHPAARVMGYTERVGE